MSIFLEDEDEILARKRANWKETRIVLELAKEFRFEGVRRNPCGNKLKILSFGSRNDREVLRTKSCYWDPELKPSVNFWRGEKAITFSNTPRFYETPLGGQGGPAPNVYNLPIEKLAKGPDFKKVLPRRDYSGDSITPG